MSNTHGAINSSDRKVKKILTQSVNFGRKAEDVLVQGANP